MPDRLTAIKTILTETNQPRFRLDEITKAIYRDGISAWNSIPYLPKTLASALSSTLFSTLTPVDTVSSPQATKVLFATASGHQLESVLLSYKSSHTALCVSSQSGCALGCTFCATGAIGFKKNLTVDEILDQYLHFLRLGHKIDSIIFMGMGEPFANSPSLFAALTQLTTLCGLSPRRISVSTVGLIPGISRLTTDFPEVNLAYSLHSPFGDQRLSLMPVTKAYPIADVFTALDNHISITNHKVFIAYLMLVGVTDSLDHAQALGDLISSRPRPDLYHINLIRYNPASSKDKFQRSPANQIAAFTEILDKFHLHYTIRRDFGTSIAAACGQLAGPYKATRI